MPKNAISEIKRFEHNQKVKCVFTLDAMDDSFDWDGENGAERMFGSIYLDVDQHVEEIKPPLVGAYYYYEYCLAPYQILAIQNLGQFLTKITSEKEDDNEKKLALNYVNELKQSGVKYWVSLKLMPMEDEDDDDVFS